MTTTNPRTSGPPTPRQRRPRPTDRRVATCRIPAMGTQVELLAVGLPSGALAAARGRLAELEARWSRFRPDSEISTLNRAAGRPVAVSPETLTLLALAVLGWQATGGRFDPTVLDALEAAGYDRSFDQLPADGHGTADNRPALGPAPGLAGIRIDPEAGHRHPPGRDPLRPGRHRQGLRRRPALRRPTGRRRGRGVRERRRRPAGQRHRTPRRPLDDRRPPPPRRPGGHPGAHRRRRHHQLPPPARLARRRPAGSSPDRPAHRPARRHRHPPGHHGRRQRRGGPRSPPKPPSWPASPTPSPWPPAWARRRWSSTRTAASTSPPDSNRRRPLQRRTL